MLHPYKLRKLVPAPECSNNGYSYLGRCYCVEGFGGNKCNELAPAGWEDTADKCDDATARLDSLFNLDPD